MSNYFFYSPILKPAQAKKVCNALMEHPGWRDMMGGSTGVVVDETAVRYNDISLAKVKEIELPEMASFLFSGKCEVRPGGNYLPRTRIGDNLTLPENIGENYFSLGVLSGDYSSVSVSISHSNSYYDQAILSQNFSSLANLTSVKEVAVGIAVKHVLPEGECKFAPHVHHYKEELELHAEVLKRFQLPTIPYDFWSGATSMSADIARDYPQGSVHCSFLYREPFQEHGPHIIYRFKYDSTLLPQWDNIIMEMQDWMISQNATYRVNSYGEYGQLNWFAGIPQCVTPEAKELLRRECENPQYEVYNVKYMKLEPESWDEREKRRKKVTQPRFMQLGECELDNGCKLTLRLKMHKQGYEVFVDFPTDEDMIKFAETDIYRMTKWENSVE